MSAAPRILTAEVIATQAITPAMRRVVLGGPEIAAFRAVPEALGPYLKLFFPGPGGRDLVRTYSTRRHDPARGELQIDVLLHEAAGPGARFGLEARCGDTVRLSGPGFIPAEPCGSYLLAGDHCSLPALARILETLPAGASARVLIETPGPEEEQVLDSAARVELTWLRRRPGQPSTLAEAVRRSLPALRGDLLVWAGAEARIARAIRAHARTVGIAPARCQVLNYWKAGQPEGGFSYVE